MGKTIENASLDRTRIEYLNSLKRLDAARTDYETSNNKTPKLLEDIKYREIEVKKYEKELRRYGINPENILCKKSGNLAKPVEKDTERLLATYSI